MEQSCRVVLAHQTGRRFTGALAKDFEARLLAGHEALPGVAVCASFCFYLQPAACVLCHTLSSCHLEIPRIVTSEVAVPKAQSRKPNTAPVGTTLVMYCVVVIKLDHPTTALWHRHREEPLGCS